MNRLSTIIMILSVSLGILSPLPDQISKTDTVFVAPFASAPGGWSLNLEPRLMPPHPSLWEKIRRGEVSLPEYMTNPQLAGPWSPDQPLQVSQGPTGTWKALAILVKFSDKNSTVSSTYFDTLLFSRTSGVSSLHNYYNAVSYGQLDIVTVNLPSALGWRQMPQTYAYYVNGEHCVNYYSYPNNCQKLAEDAVAAAALSVDFSQYDNDYDGYVDSVIIVHAGSGAELTGNNNDIWSHAWQTRTQPIYNGVRIRSFTTEPEYWLTGGDMTIGVHAHELGHVFGLPDLYDTTNLPDGTSTTEGIGEWSLMGSGCWNGPLKPSGYRLGDYPAFLDAWSRLQLGWSTVTDIYGDSTRSIAKAETNSGAIFRTWLYGGGSQEYFLVENRQKTGFDAYLPGAGLLIWHIDGAIPLRYGGGVNDYACSIRDNWSCAYPNHYRVALEQADGLWNLENKNGVRNRGDAGDAWPGSTNKRSFTWSSTPSTSSYYTSADTKVALVNIGNSGTTMSVQFITMPTAFNKIAPVNSATGQSLNPTLSWGSSAGSASYEYCYDTIDNSICDSSWHSSGASISAALSGLSPNTPYYWQVRAVALPGGTFTRDASGGWWSFTTASLPGAFNKSAPINQATNQPNNLTLSWNESNGVASYEYCISSVSACSGPWISNGTSTNVALSGLNLNTTYYWQVRGVNPIGVTYANDDASAVWVFTTMALPTDFAKSAPANGDTGQPLNPILVWSSSSGITNYEYCYDITNDNACSALWISAGTHISVTLSDLSLATIYYWQVRANNAVGSTYANNTSTAWWKFRTELAPYPGDFIKIAPTNNATDVSIGPPLSWGSSSGAGNYEYCLFKGNTPPTAGCPTLWIDAGDSLSVVLNSLDDATTYYWQVRAVGGIGPTEADGGTWYRFITLTLKWVYMPIVVK